MDISESTNVPSIQYTEETLYQSKLATEQGLLDIGRAQLLKEQEVANKVNIKENLLVQIRDYKRKSMLVSSNAVVNKIDKYLEILKEEEIEYIKQIKMLKEESEYNIEHIEDCIQEIETLENRVEGYWEPRVEKLRNKCIEKNKEISNLKKGLKFMFVLFVAFVIWSNYSIEIVWGFDTIWYYIDLVKTCIVLFLISFGSVVNWIIQLLVELAELVEQGYYSW